MKPDENRLPAGLRLATFVAITLGALVSFSAARELPLVLASESIDTPDIELGPLKALVTDEKVVKEATQASFRAQVTAIESMRTSRAVILIGLSVTAALVFVGAMRLRWPSGVTRIGVARMLGGAAIASAFLRTADGAQLLVIVRKGIVALDKVVARSSATELQMPIEVNLAISSLASVMFTLFVVAAFVLLGVYFRSQRVRDAFSRLDRDAE